MPSLFLPRGGRLIEGYLRHSAKPLKRRGSISARGQRSLTDKVPSCRAPQHCARGEYRTNAGCGATPAQTAIRTYRLKCAVSGLARQETGQFGCQRGWLRPNFVAVCLDETKNRARRFLIHVLPDGFHRIRHYGLFANANRANNIALARRLLAVPDPTPSSRASDHAENGRDDKDWNACPCCGGRMIIVEAFEPGCQPRFWPVPSIGLDSSRATPCCRRSHRSACPTTISRRQQPHSSDGALSLDLGRQNPDPSARRHGAHATLANQNHRPRYPFKPAVPSESGQVAQNLALNPHRPTLPPAHTPPAVSSFEAFRTPASVQPRAQ